MTSLISSAFLLVEVPIFLLPLDADLAPDGASLLRATPTQCANTAPVIG